MVSGDYSLVLIGVGPESVNGFFPQDFQGDLDEVLTSLNPSFSDVRQAEDSFRRYLRGHDKSTFSRWIGVYDSLVCDAVGDSKMYDPEKVSFSGKGRGHLEYRFSIGLSKPSTAQDEGSLDDVFFEVQDTGARAGARARFRSNGSIYNPETIASQNPADMRQELERSKNFAKFKLELYDLLFPIEENIIDDE